jgi:hypothetical protein
MLERLELQRRVVELVAALDEPYRTALLLRFYERREPADIALAIGVPAGTVRWRINEGLRRLRARLDEAAAGEREAWRALLLPVAASPPSAAERQKGGAPGPMSSSKLVAFGAGTLAAGFAGGLLWLAAARLPPQDGRHRPSASPASSTEMATTPPSPQARTKEEETMLKNGVKRTVALFGVVLPALAASADDGKRPLVRDDGIATCVWHWEQSQRCKEDLADVFSGSVSPEKRDQVRKKLLAEIVAAGTGPLEPRQEGCAGSIDRRSITVAERTIMQKCAAELEDCKAWLDCIKAVPMIVPRIKQ